MISSRITKRSSVSRASILTSHAVAPVLESLERRLQMDATYHAIASSPLTQDWTNGATLITTNNDWSGVPSIQGSRGTGLTGSTGVDPETIIAPEDPLVQFVDANATSFGAIKGVAFFGTNVAGITDPTIAISGSGTANAPYLQFYIDTTGVNSGVEVKYSLRGNIDTVNSSIEPIALQYRVGTSGNWTNVPSGFVSNASGTVTSVDAFLPAPAMGQANVQVRIMTADAASTDEWIGVDNISIAPGPAGPGKIGFRASSAIYNEDAGTVTVTVDRNEGSTGAASVNYAVTGGTATPAPGMNADFTLNGTGTLNFASTEFSKTFTITINDDSMQETAETIQLGLSGFTGASADTTTTETIQINDNDGAAPAAGSVLLNEIDSNPPGTDQPNEYIELKGTNGQSLDSVYVLSVEGDNTSNPGLVTAAFNLSTSDGSALGAIGSNGLAWLHSSNSPFIGDAGTTSYSFDDAFNTAGGILQNGANSFLVVYAQSGVAVGTDLDPTNGGESSLLTTLSAMHATLVDGVGWTTTTNGSPTPGDVAYGAVLPTLVAPGFTIGSVTRDPGNSTALSAGAWWGGILRSDTTTIYDAGNVLQNTPTGLVITPGKANDTGHTDVPDNHAAFALGTKTFNVTEGPGVTVTIPVYRFGSTAGTDTVSFVTNLGGADTASSSTDYTLPGSTLLTFNPTDTVKNIVITIQNDSVSEAPKLFTVTLQSPSSGTVLGTADATKPDAQNPDINATVNLSDDDAPPAPPTGSILLNELDVNTPGTDNPNEYVELKGTPGTALTGMYFISVEGDVSGSPGPGTVTGVISLNSLTVPANGLIMLDSATYGSAAQINAGTLVVHDALFDTNTGGLQNGTNSFMLIYSPTSITKNVTDIDSSTGGGTNLTPNNLPAGAVIYDGFSWTDTGAGDSAFGPTLPTVALIGANAPMAATRFFDSTTANSASAWYYGNLMPSSPSDPTQRAYDVANSKVSANFPISPVLGALTPGSDNLANQPTDITPPTVLSGVFNYDTAAPGTKQNISIVFSEAVQAVTAANLTLTQNPSGTPVNLSSHIVITNVDSTHTTLTFTDTNGALPDGQYTLTVTGVKDTAGNTMSPSFNLNFFFVNGDANHDGKVNALDFNALAANYGKLTGATFSGGDFDYNGKVDTADFNILSTHFGTVVAPFSAPLPGAGLFGSEFITAGDNKDTGGSDLIDVIA